VKYLGQIPFYSAAGLAFFTICGAVGACLGYGGGIDPINDPMGTHMLSALDKFDRTECAWNSFMGFGTFGAVLITPIFLIVRVAQGLTRYPGIIRIFCACVVIAFWSVFVVMRMLRI